jgi:dTDP-4-dehydrorhamnose reductase
VHYSTDYVFDGEKRTPYREEDQTGPLNEYGRTKLLGEQRVATEGGAYWIVRSGWIYGWRGRNFLLNMLRLGSEREELRIVDDQVGTPTSAAAIAEATLQLLEHHQQAADQAYEQACGMAGIYHAACSGETSWFRFARAIFDHARKPGGWAELKVRRVIPITTAEYPTPARRPGYSVLCKDKITRAFGLQFPGWEDDLATVMKRLAQSALEETVS